MVNSKFTWNKPIFAHFSNIWEFLPIIRAKRLSAALQVFGCLEK